MTVNPMLDPDEGVGLTAADVMTAAPLTVSPEDTLLAAWELLSRGRFRHLPVVSRDGRCVALLDDRLVIAELAAPLARPRRLVADVMPPRVHCVRKSTALRRVAQIMADERASGVPVVEESMRLVGIVTDTDVVGLVARGVLAEVSVVRPAPAR